jgi:two-component system OmpR family response regulator
MFEVGVTLNPVRVLVVDDYQSIANGLCRQLRSQGHEARSAFTGRDALAEAAAFAPDLVLLDIVLPDMTGYEVAQQLRLNSTAPLYIAAISSRRMLPDANFDDQAQKPFGVDRLSAILLEASKRAGR